MRDVRRPTGVNLSTFSPANFIAAAHDFGSPHDLVRQVCERPKGFVLPMYGEDGETGEEPSYLLVETHGMVALAAGTTSQLLDIAQKLYPGAASLRTFENEDGTFVGPDDHCDDRYGLDTLSYVITLRSKVTVLEPALV